MKGESEIRERLDELEAIYDAQDPPSSEFEDQQEVMVLRSIEELEWVLGEREKPPAFSE